MIRTVKGIAKFLGMSAISLGVLCMETSESLGIRLAVVGMAVMLFCFYHDAVEAERAAKRRKRDVYI